MNEIQKGLILKGKLIVIEKYSTLSQVGIKEVKKFK
ncbi:hypothetical protein A5881_001291 [Enterococcus termitis]